MKQQEVFNKIGGIIREINDQYEYLKSLGDVYNDLELELLVANSQFLTDHIEVLRKLNRQIEQAKQSAEIPAVTTDEIIAEPSYFEPMAQEYAPAFFNDETVVPAAGTPHIFEFEMARRDEHAADLTGADYTEEAAPEPQPEMIRHELTLEDIGEDWDEDEDEASDDKIEPETEVTAQQPVEKNIEPEPQAPAPEPITKEPEPEIQPAIVAAPHTQILVEEDKVITFNDKMSAQLGGSRMSDQLGGQPITDLKSAISLNDKLLYIKDLFNGYSLAYSEAIELLNRVKTFEEAQKFLNASYATKNNWQDKQATVDKFYALLQKRYTSESKEPLL